MRLPAAGRRRRRAVAAGPGAGPRVAPGHRLRGGRPRIHPVRPQRRRVDLLAPRAARRARASCSSGYGWVFPLGADAGEVNIGVGTLATARRPAGVQLQGAAGDLHRRPPRGVAARGPGARAGVGAAADGRGGVGRRRAQLGADRRRRRLRQPAQRRGHRLRPGDRAARRRPVRRGRLGARRGRRSCAGTTARRSPSPGGWPDCSPCRGSCPPPGRWACGRAR